LRALFARLSVYVTLTFATLSPDVELFSL
jgi:hypothetical protein